MSYGFLCARSRLPEAPCGFVARVLWASPRPTFVTDAAEANPARRGYERGVRAPVGELGATSPQPDHRPRHTPFHARAAAEGRADGHAFGRHDGGRVHRHQNHALRQQLHPLQAHALQHHHAAPAPGAGACRSNAGVEEPAGTCVISYSMWASTCIRHVFY